MADLSPAQFTSSPFKANFGKATAPDGKSAVAAGLIALMRTRLVSFNAAILSVAIVLGLVTALPAGAKSPAQPALSPDAALAQIIIQTASGPRTWSLELADTPQETARGLMYREQMDAQHGMLFRFGSTRMVDMWMKNTFIPLDMIFFDEAGRISHIHKGAVPQSLDIISSNVPARFVLEVNAGEADAYGLATGQTASHPWFGAAD